MERSDDSNESGYDGGSQENILEEEPRYESIGKRKEQLRKELEERRMAKEEERRGKVEENKERNGKAEENKVDNKSEENCKNVKADDKDLPTEKKPNGNAQFCNGNKSEDSGDECSFESKKVTIHAVIETVHKKQEEIEESDEDDLYEKIQDFRQPNDDSRECEKSYEKEFDDSLEPNKEVVYSHVTLNKTVKKEEKEDEKRNTKPIVQEMVKIAEQEGAPPKIPTPPPFKNFEKGPNSTFMEEEYSYEPELKKSSSKLVMRTRSLMNLDEENRRSNIVRPPAVRMKITTAPDGTFVIDGRKATSELNLADEIHEGSPKQQLRVSISGEDLRRRKEEIFKPKQENKKDSKVYFEEINQNKTKTTKEEAILNLKKYLQEKNIGLRELLTNNNVVIIDTFREKKPCEDLSEYNHKAARECRITGTTAKGEIRESNTLPRANKVHQPMVQRHYFYSLFKHRPSPPDEELPDPDKVRSTRQMFQKSKEKVNPMRIMMPIAAKISNPKKEARPTPEVRVINLGTSPRRWTDSGSVSSGVSSDMSMLDTLSDKCYTSEDEVEDEEPISPIIDSHPISPEVMKKIRECGTTITYYGGRVISHTHGAGNPMTMTIMDEIRKGRDGGKGKFRLVKSNSCGSRLELAGTEDAFHYQEASRNRFFTDVYGGSPLSEELRGSLKTVQEEGREEQPKKEKNTRRSENKKNNANIANKFREEISDISNDKKPSWRELIESRKQRKVMEHNRRPCPDMVFEEFQVLET